MWPSVDKILLIPPQRLFEGGHPAGDVERHAVALEAHTERMERLEEVVRAALLASYVVRVSRTRGRRQSPRVELTTAALP